MPAAIMPNPVTAPEVRLPVLPVELPVSSAFNVSLPLPVTITAPWMLSKIPFAFGAKLPMLIVFMPLPVSTLAVAPVARMLIVSLLA